MITFDRNDIYIGKIIKGKSKEVKFNFTNTGSRDLMIELVTSCKCTAIDFPRKPIPPGGKGEIVAIFDTSDQELGKLKKTIDIIANTNPIVVEAFFRAIIIAPNIKG